ncbi:tetratricopeptide repeat protein [Desulfovibrio legallii]|jgi:Tfp pilus assembly protein PilF|uniref:Tfp pilus assembly protein PilF n=1 Tax=Desulfovibrio legallii TaxID=571438 RepID=A0A1G7M5Q7_9BACT|nr:tetratricopeptide repeat protein [Desulfovibrio legallii]SDF56916.1 Tfp pilus assembly protein PilF [Desulfovibrio legallii]
MLTTAPKEIRENVARATGYLRRDEVERALLTMAEALKRYAGVRLLRSARAELDIQIDEFLVALVHHRGMQPLLDPAQTGKPRAIPFQAGKEAALATVLEGLAKILQKESAQAEQQENAARQERKKQLIAAGLRFLQEGQTAKGRAFLKRVAEEFSDEKDIRLQLGQIFAAAGQDTEAAAMYEEAMEAQPREAAAYTGAVAAWLRLHEYEKAENVYKAVLRTFGGHPATFGKMARMYLEWHKKQAAEDAALRALQADPQQPDALEVLDALRRR